MKQASRHITARGSKREAGDVKEEQNETVVPRPVRSLDLTGPLLLGGVPKLPEDFPIRNRQFVGCMKNLRVDSQHVDMAGFIANNGTLPG